jgi:hypothetical protein
MFEMRLIKSTRQQAALQDSHSPANANTYHKTERRKPKNFKPKHEAFPVFFSFFAVCDGHLRPAP